MKNVFSTFGFIFLVSGVIFKIQHYPYSRFLIIGGLICSIISFLLPKKEKRSTSSDILDEGDIPEDKQESKGKKIAENIRTAGITIIVAALIIHYLRLPGRNILIIIGTITAITGALLRLKHP